MINSTISIYSIARTIERTNYCTVHLHPSSIIFIHHHHHHLHPSSTHISNHNLTVTPSPSSSITIFIQKPRIEPSLLYSLSSSSPSGFVIDFSQEVRCFQTVTCFQAVVNNLDDAHELIDTAISTALKESKPAYISISCNLPGISHPTFAREPVPYFLSPKVSNQLGLEAAVEATVEFLNKAVKPILIGGPKLRVAKAQQAFVELADTCGYPIAVMPAGKGLVPEHHPHFIGTYWGAVSTSYVGEVVESADAYVFVGPIFNDYSSVGYSLLIKKERAVIVEPNRVTIANGPSYGWVFMADFLCALAKKLKRNTTAMENYRRIFVPPGMPVTHANGEPLRVNVLFKHVQDMIDGNTAVIAETGDSWFNCQKLRLPEGCGYFFSPVVE